MSKATLCLWFNNDAREAAEFYAATFPDGVIAAAARKAAAAGARTNGG